MSRVLVVEDEAHLAKGLRFNLEAEGHAVEVCGDGESAIERLLANNEHFDAVVLDVMLPGKDGFAVASALRKAKNYVPVLMLTARGRPEDVLQGFAAGADDYLPKPFQLPIFFARLQGLLRRNEWLRPENTENKKRAGADAAAKSSRSDANGKTKAAAASAESSSQNADADVFAFDGKTIDFNNLELHANSATIQLTLMEAKLLRHLIRSKGNPVSRKSILEDVWGLHEDTDTRAIDNFIVRLRRYIEKDPSKPRHLTTVRGVGYRFIA
jgi:DNA-binding response OmpR family regulator